MFPFLNFQVVSTITNRFSRKVVIHRGKLDIFLKLEGAFQLRRGDINHKIRGGLTFLRGRSDVDTKIKKEDYNLKFMPYKA